MAIELVTSENREEYMEKKLAEKAGKKPMESQEEAPKVKVKKMNDDQLERAMKHPRFAKLKLALGKKGAIDAILKSLNDNQ